MTPKQILLAVSALAACALVVAPAALGSERISSYRSKMEKWVETRQILSQERSEWEVEREMLKATQRLLREQKEALAEEIQELEQGATAADDERRELLLARAELQRSSQVLADEIRAMEVGILELAEQFPPPLQEKLEPLLVQIPEDPDKTRLKIGQRLMNVLGVLAQAEKFNGTASFVGETRPLEDGRKVSVRTLYWGLAQAFFVDTQGETAGVGSPAKGGWVFRNDPDLADDAKLLLDIYEGNVDTIEFVGMPVEIQ